ncbi:hypothetical protein [Polaribacter sp. R77954]|uniref:hypothetical protein n=1 Tax=Polaribacter sp. R77954 TaxID=3093870 RepID=UPI0037C54741
MVQLNINDLEQIQAGNDFIDGMCHGFTGGAGVLGFAALGVKVGWFAAIPGLNVALGVFVASAAVTCAVNGMID